MAETQVCAASDVPENGVISREVGDELVAIYNIDGTYYATEARCSHGMADLADGTLEGDVIDALPLRRVPRRGQGGPAPLLPRDQDLQDRGPRRPVFVDLDTPAPTARRSPNAIGARYCALAS
jgi:hypothetical protein